MVADLKVRSSAIQPTVQTPWRACQTRALKAHAAILFGTIHPAHPHAAAPAAAAAGAIHQFITQEGQGVFLLQRFHRQVGGVGQVNMDAAQAIGGRTRATAAANRLQIDPKAAVKARSRELNPRAGTVSGGRNSAGQRLCQGSLNDVRNALTRCNAAIDGGRMTTIEQRPFGRRYGQGAGQTGIGQDGRVDDRFDRVVTGRQERGVDDIEAGPDLGRRVKGQVHVAAADGDLNAERHVALDDIAVENVAERIGAVGRCLDSGAHLPFGIVQKRIPGCQHLAGAVLGA